MGLLALQNGLQQFVVSRQLHASCVSRLYPLSSSVMFCVMYTGFLIYMHTGKSHGFHTKISICACGGSRAGGGGGRVESETSFLASMLTVCLWNFLGALAKLRNATVSFVTSVGGEKLDFYVTFTVNLFFRGLASSAA
jgi:hypothetical protein